MNYRKNNILNPVAVAACIDCSPVTCRSSAERQIVVTRDLWSQPVIVHSTAEMATPGKDLCLWEGAQRRAFRSSRRDLVAVARLEIHAD